MRVRRFYVAALAMTFACTTPAWAKPADATMVSNSVELAPGHFEWDDDPSIPGDVSVVVSIPDQRAYVYRGTSLVAVSTVSTGKDGKDTPIGVYPILQKQTMHRSNLYQSAPMPFMQRLTWDGIALHSGKNPGFPASHGCVRMPDGFARKLFAVTSVGSVVSVVDTTVTSPDADHAYDAPAQTVSAPQDSPANTSAQTASVAPADYLPGPR